MLVRAARAPVGAFVIVFVLAFAARAAFLPFTPIELILEPGAEAGYLARTLAATGRFADPYGVPTGPTAHLPPGFPGIVAMLYLVFGMTEAAGYARCLLIITVYSALYAMMPWLAGRLGVGRSAGLAGGLIGALTPRWPSQVCLAWEQPYAAIALGLLTATFLRRWETAKASWPGSLVLGVGTGAVLHLAPNLLPVVLGYAAFELWWSSGRSRALPLVVVAGIALACVPWGWRNYRQVGGVPFVRSNLGMELRIANSDTSEVSFEETLRRGGGRLRHPGDDPRELAKFRDLGEMEYMRGARQEALDWIVSNPGAFLRLTALRFARFWLGPMQPTVASAAFAALTLLAALGAWRTLPVMSLPQRAALIIPLATFPIIYYVVSHWMRYRVPIEWILLLLAGAEVRRWIPGGRSAAPAEGNRRP